MGRIATLWVKVAADIADLERGLSKVERATVKIGDSLANVGQKMTVGLTAPILGVAAAATKMAADANEAASKMEAVFGPATESMNAWIGTLRETVPATTAELQGMTSEIQDLLVPLGLAPAAATEMTKGITTLAADLASFNNIPMSEALERIRSGMVGQYEPLLKFGVALSASTVKAEALRLGLIKQGQELDAATRAQVVLRMTLERTTAAHGDAARTATSAANTFKFFWSNVKELGAVFGQVLLPAIVPVVQTMASVAKRMQEASPGTMQMVAVIGLLVAAIGPLLLVLGTIMKMMPVLKLGFAALTGPIGLGILAFGALVAAGIAIVNNWKIIKFEVARMVDGIRDALVGRFNAIVDSVRNKVEAVTGFFRNMYDKVVGHSYVPDMVKGIGDSFKQLYQLMTKPAKDATDQVTSSFKSAAQNVLGLTAEFDRLSGGTGGLTAQIEIMKGVFDRQAEVTSRLKDLRLDLAFERDGEKAKKLRENITEAETSLRALEAAVKSFGEAWRLIDLPDIKVGLAGPGTKGDPKLRGGTIGPEGGTHAQTEAAFKAWADSLVRETAPVIKGLTDTQRALYTLEEYARTAGNALLGAGKAFVSGVGNAFMKIAGLFNPLTIVTTAFDQAIRNASGSMDGKFAESIQKIVQILVDALGPVLDALVPVFEAFVPVIRDLSPIIQAVAKIFAALMKAVAPILQALVPLLRALFPVFKFLAIVTTYVGQVFAKAAQIVANILGVVAKVIGTVIYVIGKAIDALPFISGKPIMKFGKGLIDAGDELFKIGDAFGDTFKALGDAREEIKGIELDDPAEEAADSINDMSKAANNAADRLNHLAAPVTVTADPGRGGPTIHTLTQPAGVTVAVEQQHFHGVQDPDEMVRQVAKRARVDARRGGATDLQVAIA